MKKNLLSLIALTFTGMSVFAQSPDLPGPGSNLQTMPTGSYIIAMDNQNQGSGSGTFNAVINNRPFNYISGNPVITAVTNTTGILVGIPAGATVIALTATTVTLSAAPTNTQNNKNLDFGNIVYSGADFNLKAYGLLVHLLNNNVKLKWIIKAGKAKDAIDFSVNATRVKPSLGAATNFDFTSGPFVIFQQDTTGVAALVQSFNGAASSDDVKMYKSNAPATVDVRFDYLIRGIVWKPKAAVLDDGGNADIHVGYMVNAGIPATNYTVEVSVTFITRCYTFASEPHNTSAPDNIIQGIRNFVLYGGNFLAQCAAVRTYELSTLARFQSTNGFDNANENGDPATWTYSNADLSYFQINGYFGIADNGGSLKDWVIPVSPGNPAINNFHYHTSGTESGRNYTNASVSKLVPSSQLGGQVFYLGSHSYDGSADYDINGQRMYMNALLTPTDPQGALTNTAVTVCGNPVKVFTGSSAPAALAIAYPITFTLYEDLAPAGYNVGDIQLGNVVTMTAPNTYQGGISQITGPNVPNNNLKNFVVAIRPANSCFQPQYVQSFCSTLPVSLLSFSATRNSSLVNLKWTTTSEQNSKGFDIERMMGNGSWENIGTVNSKAPGGNSNADLFYTYVDNNNFKGISQYRLKQIDFDNNFKVSEIRVVRGEDQKSGSVFVYPNPSNGKVNVVFENNGSAIHDLSLNDMIGRTIKQWKGITANSIQIDNLVPGIYSLRVVNRVTGDQTVEKIAVNKQ
jgi:hypothetical protein